ncbi:peptide ABC transporter ATP-binding protein [Nostoc sp. 3335mG]|nr:peptide ABC transporter ATP-binding protein [Nostoc sp. 3335mG]
MLMVEIQTSGSGSSSPLNEKAALAVRGLTISIPTARGPMHLVEKLDFSIAPGKTLCIVGESGSGKSITALALMRLLHRALEITNGSVDLNGTELLALSNKDMRKIRGSEISMIFQEPMTSLNPAYTVGNQIVEAITTHRRISADAARDEAIRLLREVNIPAPEQRLEAYPHQLSGGMRQRVMIALALANNPSVLIADEPTTALDVTVQAQILDLMRNLRNSFGASVIFITHDLGVVREIADDVLVLYAGRVMEYASARDIFENPQHPYTLGLFAALPNGRSREPLTVIPGLVPLVGQFPQGCRFSTRCALATDKCRTEQPPLETLGNDHKVACWYAPIEVTRA